MYILPILYKIARYCTGWLNIACCYTSCNKLYILPILLKIAQNCSIYALASISRSFLSEMPHAAALQLAASMLPVPLTVLLLYEFTATIHLLSTIAPCSPQQGGQQRLHEPVNLPVPWPGDRRAVHLQLKLDYALPADYSHASTGNLAYQIS